MKLKELLPFLPRFSDNSGYDACVAVYDHSFSPAWFRFARIPDDCKKVESCFLYPWKTPKDIYESEVSSIESGHLFAGGNFDETLYIIVKEPENDNKK